MVLQGADGIRTRMVCGYNPCHSMKKATRYSYQQQRRYFTMKEKDRTCSRTGFKNDLLAQLRKWREQGDRLIVCMDVNEDIYRNSIGKYITMSEDLQMIEAVGNYTGKKIGATFFRGTKPIDGVCNFLCSHYRSVCNAGWLRDWRSSPFCVGLSNVVLDRA